MNAPLPAAGADAINDYFCPCPRGLEDALVSEVRAAGATDAAALAGGVMCRGALEAAYRINLHSRLASRVMLLLARGSYRNEDDLYRLAVFHPWEEWFDNRCTLRVDITAIRSPLTSLNFATLRVKDGIVDRLRERTGERPSIDTTRPDVRVAVFLQEGAALLYIDLSGEPLFKRGWRADREAKGEAPLKENLAAGLLALAGWHPGIPLMDVFCGAGTLVIEAAQQACNRPPGLQRQFGIERLSIHRPALWQQVQEEAEAAMVQAARQADRPPIRIAASDLDPYAVAMARGNLQRAGLPLDIVHFNVCDAVDARPLWPQAGVLISNPPYNERVSIDTATWREFGVTLRNHFGGWRALLLTSERRLPGQVGLRERRKTPLFNGQIECRLFEFEMRRRDAAGPVQHTA